jgi:DNA invertase Pin-like site-specific DNA recombinase
VTVGYACVSTDDQTLAPRQDALEQASCTEIFTDTISGARAERPGLDEALRSLREGETLVVWRLDRLGRSLRYLIEVMSMLNDRRMGSCSLTEQIDTTTSGGKLVFHVFGALAEFERDLIRERTKAGLAAARARGHLGGRRKALSTPTKVAMAQALYNDKRHSISEI